MQCNRIRLERFRNIGKADVSFSPGVNLLWGDNAQGKTNLLEAIYFSALGKSFRPAKEAELILFGEQSSLIRNDFFSDGREKCTEMQIFSDKRQKIVKINHLKVNRMSDAVGEFRVVLFSPEHLSLIKEGPLLRRNFLDVAISQIKPMYLRSLQKYNQILKQRNSLIKSYDKNPEVFASTIELWSSQLAHEAAFLAEKRVRYTRLVSDCMKRCFEEMTQSREVPEIQYIGSAKQEEEEYLDIEKTEKKFMQLLMSHHDREIYNGATLYGIHKDDLDIRLNGNSARLFASQGQQRSLALAMKLAEGEICRMASIGDVIRQDSPATEQSGGEYPVFLLDDVLSELDEKRCAYLMNEIKNRQVIMTSCDGSLRFGQYTENDRFKVIRVRNGEYE